MYTRMIKPARRSFFLFGPRGTGKTTWLKTTLKDSVYLDLLDASVHNSLFAYPNRLENYIPVDFNNWVVIDEIQRSPDLLNEVHRLIEARKLRFVLTGSSARTIRRKGTNLLAGRASTYTMFPLTAKELKADFELDRALERGLLPTAYIEDDFEEYLASYIQTYLREEVLHEGLTRNLGAFARFLEAASFSQGAPLNMSAVARECGVDRKVVENYFGILEDLLIGVRLPVFKKRAERRLTQHPKFYFFDAGVYRALRPRGPLDRPEEIDGATLETLVFQELRAINAIQKTGYDLYYWRTARQIEVDFVLYGKSGLIGIEVKRSSKLRGSDFRGLKAFMKDYPMARAVMLYGGHRVMTEGGSIEIVPVDEFLKDITKYL